MRPLASESAAPTRSGACGVRGGPSWRPFVPAKRLRDPAARTRLASLPDSALSFRTTPLARGKPGCSMLALSARGLPASVTPPRMRRQSRTLPRCLRPGGRRWSRRTSRAAELGDAAWRELLAQHHESMRTQLGCHRGREVDTAGDGMFALFDGAARALDCAAAIRAIASEDSVPLRIGVHVGEVELTAKGARGVARAGGGAHHRHRAARRDLGLRYDACARRRIKSPSRIAVSTS